MRLKRARVTNYRSIKDTGYFDVDSEKTIFVGPNEAGKTAILQALQHLEPPDGILPLDPLRDYPRSKYNEISTKKVDPSTVEIVEGHFTLDPADQALVEEDFRGCTYILGTRLNNKRWHKLEGGPPVPLVKDIRKDLQRLAAHLDDQAKARAAAANAASAAAAQTAGSTAPVPIAPVLASAALASFSGAWLDSMALETEPANSLADWLNKHFALVAEGNQQEVERHERLLAASKVAARRKAAIDVLGKRVPTFVLFNNYFRVRPLIQLDHLAQRIDSKVLDDDEYDYGNVCLLKLLGFTASQLSTLGAMPEPRANDPDGLKTYRDSLDNRQYQLNAASVRLTSEIRKIWAPDAGKGEADKLRVTADRQYLKVMVEDDLGVDIELNQRSEGFQWLVSFFVVFFAEAADKHKNAVLLLDEPGLNLHGLKQREFRNTLSRLATENQTLYTTHSPFLVGPEELDRVRVVEMNGRDAGTKVHTTVTSTDAASLLPLQEALGYDMAQSLFSQQRNLVLEGLTDYWYVDATSALLREAGSVSLSEKLALVPAGSASKVAYFATILHAQKLKVVALLDSDAAGDHAAQQDTLVHTLGQKAIVRTKDAYAGAVKQPQIEDLLRETLIDVALSELTWDVRKNAESAPKDSIVKVFELAVPEFSKYKLAKAYLRWARTHSAADLTADERKAWGELADRITRALK